MDRQIYTVGHSNHSMERFLELLRTYDVEVLVDVRSSPYTKYATHFNQSSLSASIKLAGLKYLYLGAELGGIPKDRQFYDRDGHVLYWKIAESKMFKDAIARVMNGISVYTVALMCGEENPESCHRHMLLSRVLKSEGISVKHIRGDGHIEMEEDLASRNAPQGLQLQLFSDNDEYSKEWKSGQPVLRDS